MQAPSVRRRAARAIASLVTALATALAASVSAADTPPAEWHFTVRLDGEPIGTHRFVLAADGDSRLALSSDAQYQVKLLGIPVYRYQHQASERWAGGCLASIDAHTNDNGRLAEVQGRAQDGRFDLQVRDRGRASEVPAATSGCLMSFAYWNPAIAGQRRLLDPGSGRVESVTITVPEAVPTDLQANAQAVRGLRISGLPQPIDIWYAGDRWVGLDTVVGGGRHLSYRLH